MPLVTVHHGSIRKPGTADGSQPGLRPSQARSEFRVVAEGRRAALTESLQREMGPHATPLSSAPSLALWIVTSVIYVFSRAGLTLGTNQAGPGFLCSPVDRIDDGWRSVDPIPVR